MEPRHYGPFPYTPINDRPKLEWPGGARLAVWVIPNIEFFPLTRGISGSIPARATRRPSVRAWAQRDYGNRVGIWRLMDVLKKTRNPRQPDLEQRHLRPSSADRPRGGRAWLESSATTGPQAACGSNIGARGGTGRLPTPSSRIAE